MKRTFPIPVAALGLSVSTACGGGPVGDWALTELTSGGERYDLPLTMSGSDTDDGVTYSYSYTLSVTLEVEDDGDAAMVYTYDFSGTATEDGVVIEEESYTETDVEAASWEGGRRAFTLTLDFVVLDCAIDGDALRCEGDIERETYEGDTETERMTFDAVRSEGA